MDYVARARELLPLIGEAAAGVEAGRRLDDGVIAALHEAGLFRMMMPRWLGGGEAPPSEFVQVIETIARADASTAWCLSQMKVCSLSSVYLEREAAAEVFGGERRGARLGLDAGREGGAGAGRLPGHREMGVRQRLPSRDLARRPYRRGRAGRHAGPRAKTASRSNARCCSRNRRRASPMSGMCWACAAPAATSIRSKIISSRRSTRSPRCSAGPTRSG